MLCLEQPHSTASLITSFLLVLDVVSFCSSQLSEQQPHVHTMQLQCVVSCAIQTQMQMQSLHHDDTAQPFIAHNMSHHPLRMRAHYSVLCCTECAKCQVQRKLYSSNFGTPSPLTKDPVPSHCQKGQTAICGTIRVQAGPQAPSVCQVPRSSHPFPYHKLPQLMGFSPPSFSLSL